MKKVTALPFTRSCLLPLILMATHPMTPQAFSQHTAGYGTYEFGVTHDLESRIKYTIETAGYGTDKFDVKRSTTCAYLGYGDLFIAGGVIHKTEVETSDGYGYPVPLFAESAFYYLPEPGTDVEGDGFVAAIGLRSDLWNRNSISLTVCGQLTHQRDSCDSTRDYTWYDSPVFIQEQTEMYPPMPMDPTPHTGTLRTDIDIRSTEITIALLASCTGTRYSLYLGVELVPYSSIEAEVSLSGSDGTDFHETYDVERDSMATFLLGWQAHFRHAFLLLESRAGGEKGLRAGGGLAF